MHRFRKNRVNCSLWAWGYNGYGKLGLGNTSNRSSPVQVGALATWTAAVGGDSHSMAIKSDGTLWAWGNNANGGLGLGDVANRSSPVQVGTDTTWTSVRLGGYQNSFAIKSNGTLWAWGRNTSPFADKRGALGLGDIINRSSPVQVGASTNWKEISTGRVQALAIQSDGTLWSWGGENQYGQLGLGDRVSRSSPVQVGALTTWTSVASGKYHSLALQSNGTLWAWGHNGYGPLGLGDAVSRSSPVQVGTDTTWVQAAVLGNHSLALQSNGTLWAWGKNTRGQLGLGDTVDGSSPAQGG